jgi:hypothetical protein
MGWNVCRGCCAAISERWRLQSHSPGWELWYGVDVWVRAVILLHVLQEHFRCEPEILEPICLHHRHELKPYIEIWGPS